jgi:MoaA/NifB/PqqE/SkfB family radical SAM enzyme
VKRRARRSLAVVSEPVLTCRAPAVNLHFSIAGTVNACCENGRYDLGDVTTQTLEQIWHGDARREMVEALDRGDYPMGCELCEVEHGLGNRASTPAPPFDHLELGEWPRQLEFTLSNRCNLACIQCTGWNSSTIRKQREGLPPLPMPYGDAFFEQLVPFLEHAEVVTFLGGEPFLTPEAKRVWDLLIEHDLHPRVQVTTNATVWTAEVERYVHALKMDFALSIDGATAETYETVRVGADFGKVMANRERFLAAARTYGGRVQVNWCLLPQNWHEVGRYLLEADELGIVGNVIPVFQPEAFSVFALPADEVAAIAAQLEAEDAEIRDRLGANRGAWDHVLRMLREHARRMEADDAREAQRVAITRRWEARADVAAAAAEEELVAWAGGRRPIEVWASDRRIVEVAAPEWAAPFRSEGWVGMPLEDIDLAVAAALGPVERLPAADPVDEDGLVVFTRTRVATTVGPVVVRAAYVPNRERLLLAVADDLPA